MDQLPIAELFSRYGLLSLLVKGALITAVSLFIYYGHAASPAAVRHRIVAGGLLTLALLPLLAIAAPAWDLAILPRSPDPETSHAGKLELVAAWIYGLVALALSARLVYQLILTGVRTIRATPVERTSALLQSPAIAETPRLRVKSSAQVSAPVTWGAIRPTLLLPEGLPGYTSTQREMIYRHECAHVRRGDWLITLLARWVLVLYWPVPGLRTLFRCLQLSAEQACDDAVIAAGVSTDDYAELLVQQSRRASIPASVALADPSDLAVRVRYLVGEIVDRSALDASRRWVYPLCALLAIPLAMVSLSEVPAVYRTVPLTRPVAADPLQAGVAATQVTQQITRPEPPAEVARPPDLSPPEATP